MYISPDAIAFFVAALGKFLREALLLAAGLALMALAGAPLWVLAVVCFALVIAPPVGRGVWRALIREARAAPHSLGDSGPDGGDG